MSTSFFLFLFSMRTVLTSSFQSCPNTDVIDLIVCVCVCQRRLYFEQIQHVKCIYLGFWKTYDFTYNFFTWFNGKMAFQTISNGFTRHLSTHSNFFSFQNGSCLNSNGSWQFIPHGMLFQPFKLKTDFFKFETQELFNESNRIICTSFFVHFLHNFHTFSAKTMIITLK